MTVAIGRRELLAALSSAAAWPLAARAQQPGVPLVGFIRDGTADASARYVAAFRKGLSEIGVVEGQNVTVEYPWREGRYDRLSRAVQLATLTARSRIPATYSLRDYVAVGGLMSYGTDFTEAFRQVGVYTGKILRGAKPTDLQQTPRPCRQCAALT